MKDLTFSHYEYQAVYPASLDINYAELETRSGGKKHCEAIVKYVNSRLRASGNPARGFLERRKVYASEWEKIEDE